MSHQNRTGSTLYLLISNSANIVLFYSTRGRLLKCSLCLFPGKAMITAGTIQTQMLSPGDPLHDEMYESKD